MTGPLTKWVDTLIIPERKKKKSVLGQSNGINITIVHDNGFAPVID